MRFDLTGILADGPVELGHDDDFVARDVVLLQGLADNHFGLAVGIHVGGIPGVQSHIVGGLEERQGLFSLHVSNARAKTVFLRNEPLPPRWPMASSSSRQNSCIRRWARKCAGRSVPGDGIRLWCPRRT